MAPKKTVPIPESAYDTEAHANKQYDKERGELKKLNPNKTGWLGSGKQSDNIASDQAKADAAKKSNADFEELDVPSYKKGGKIKKTGLAYMHKGEKVTPVGKKNGKSPKRAKVKLEKKKSPERKRA